MVATIGPVPWHMIVERDSLHAVHKYSNEPVISDNENRANAEHLALCWNTHEGLVAALEMLLYGLKSHEADWHLGQAPCLCFAGAAETAGEFAKAALAAAKGVQDA